MPSTGTPRSKIFGSHSGAFLSYTLAGPPERMMPRGCNSRTRSAARSWRTIWQKTFCSRTRRAISWPYCEPKSKIRTRSLSGSGVMGVPCRSRSLFRVGGVLGEQFLKRGFVGHFAAAPESLDLHVDLVAVID